MTPLSRCPFRLIALLALPLVLQGEGLQFGMRLGAGVSLGNTGNQNTRGGVLLGAELGYQLPKGEAFAGLQYNVFRAYDYEATRFGTGYGANGSTGSITKYVIHPSDNRPQADGRYDSADIRKANLEGVTLRFGYRFPALSEDLTVQGGLNLSFLRSKQDVTASIKVVQNRQPFTGSNPPAGTNVVLGSESYYTQFQKSTARPGLFVGARYKITQDVFVESNLSAFGYSEINFIPYSYSGQASRTEMTNRIKTVWEVSAGMRF